MVVVILVLVVFLMVVVLMMLVTTAGRFTRRVQPRPMLRGLAGQRRILLQRERYRLRFCLVG